MGMGIFSLHRDNKVMSTQLRVPNTSLTSFLGASGVNGVFIAPLNGLQRDYAVIWNVGEPRARWNIPATRALGITVEGFAGLALRESGIGIRVLSAHA
eukprot:8150482-Heterocapsa_arctica.AAC.1